MHLGDFDPARVAEIQSPFTQNVVNTTQDWFNNQNKIQPTIFSVRASGLVTPSVATVLAWLQRR